MTVPYKRVLVPLDGSSLAESAIGDAVAVAEATNAELELLEVIAPIAGLLETEVAHPLPIDEQIESRRSRALEYLGRARHRIGGRVAVIKVAVSMGDPAECILEHARVSHVDLIVMATHGRSGAKRWILGSVADRVLRRAEIPVLLVRAHQPA